LLLKVLALTVRVILPFGSLLAYLIGKPAETVNPDRLDLKELRLFPRAAHSAGNVGTSSLCGCIRRFLVA
jgi:hypothetical protein